jgi:hypothetical protein
MTIYAHAALCEKRRALGKLGECPLLRPLPSTKAPGDHRSGSFAWSGWREPPAGIEPATCRYKEYGHPCSHNIRRGRRQWTCAAGCPRLPSLPSPLPSAAPPLSEDKPIRTAGAARLEDRKRRVVRHEALFDRAEVECLRRWPVVAGRLKLEAA